MYRWYSTDTGLVEVADEPVALFPGAGYHQQVSAPAMTLTADGEAAATAAVHSLIDRCADSDDSRLLCPVSMDDFLMSLDGFGTGDLTRVDWSVVSYPQLAFEMDRDRIVVADREPGIVAVSAIEKPRGEPDTEVPVSGRCRLSGASVELVIEVDGSMTTMVNRGDGRVEPSGDENWGSCEI